MPDQGEVLLAGRSVSISTAAARQLLGYCPQFEALPAAMTGREVLLLYARLRGVTEAELHQLAAHLLDRCVCWGGGEAEGGSGAPLTGSLLLGLRGLKLVCCNSSPRSCMHTRTHLPPPSRDLPGWACPARQTRCVAPTRAATSAS